MALGAIEVSIQYDSVRFLKMQMTWTRFSHQLPQHLQSLLHRQLQPLHLSLSCHRLHLRRRYLWFRQLG